MAKMPVRRRFEDAAEVKSFLADAAPGTVFEYFRGYSLVGLDKAVHKALFKATRPVGGGGSKLVLLQKRLPRGGGFSYRGLVLDPATSALEAEYSDAVRRREQLGGAHVLMPETVSRATAEVIRFRTAASGASSSRRRRVAPAVAWVGSK